MVVSKFHFGDTSLMAEARPGCSSDVTQDASWKKSYIVCMVGSLQYSEFLTPQSGTQCRLILSTAASCA